MAEIKKDCFAYRVASETEKEYCSALSALYCARNGKCNFYKKVNKTESEEKEKADV